ncbi:MAG: restriction endonuclease subunit S [Candidatus Dojkabacteria bacterium]|nr:restriction endonuclease subunit S [Candidatus Dojkabacteria bacterium]MDD4560995.1 restriction endonuclease subunit S [Candidatus Dojkabacteria bacterium]
MKDTYKTVKLGDIAEINSRQINKDFSFKNIRYIDIASVTKGSIDNIQDLQTSKAPSRAKRLVKKNDILYSTVRPNLEHYTFIKNDLPNNTVASTGFAVITPNQDLVNPYYLYCLITQSQFTQYLSQVAEQAVSTYPTVSPNVIADLELSLPPLSEQKRIANILSSFDNKIEQLKKENKILEDIAENIFKEWFVKYNFPNKDRKPYKDSGGKMIDSELGPIPKGWRVGKLGEICELKSGFAFKGEDFVKNSSTEVVKIKDILGQGQIDTSNLSYVSNSVIEQNSKLSKFILSEGDILIAMSGNTTGKIGLMPKTEKNIFLNQRVGKIFFKNLAYYSFVYNFLMTNNYEQKILNMGYGSAQPNINPEQIAAIRIVLPNTTILQKYKTFSTYFIKKQLHNLRLIALYKHTRNNLLNKLY